MSGVFSIEAVGNCCPAIAVPMTVKMPEPMTAPMPRAVRDTGPNVFFRAWSGFSESEISLSMDLRENIWDLACVPAGRDGCAG